MWPPCEAPSVRCEGVVDVPQCQCIVVCSTGGVLGLGLDNGQSCWGDSYSQIYSRGRGRPSPHGSTTGRVTNKHTSWDPKDGLARVSYDLRDLEHVQALARLLLVTL